MNYEIPGKKTSSPKKFLFVSLSGLITDVALHVQTEGHPVKYYIEEEIHTENGDGIVHNKITDWKKHINWADIVVFDDVLGHGTLADDLRKKGKIVIGGTPYTDMLEDDRSFGQAQMSKHGIKILPYKEFSFFDDAIAYVNANPGKYVIKPSGEAQNIKRLLFVGQEDDGSDVLRVLRAYRETWQDEIKTFQLQKKVSAGVEVAVGAFFNGHEFVYPININFEHKKLFPGELGVATGEMGTSMFWSKPNKLFFETLSKMEGALRKELYCGYIDINCIVNGNGIYPLEFTARFGYPTIAIQLEAINMGAGDFLYGIASGTLTSFLAKKGFQVGARIVTPPFPYKDAKTFDSFSRNAVVVFKKTMTEGIHIEEIKSINDQWVITGVNGVALVVTGQGITMREAQKQMYGRIANIMIPNMYYRTDIGDRWFTDSDKLHTWGYLREN